MVLAPGRRNARDLVVLCAEVPQEHLAICASPADLGRLWLPASRDDIHLPVSMRFLPPRSTLPQYGQPQPLPIAASNSKLIIPRTQLLGRLRHHLQLLHQAPLEPLVAALQLHHQRRARLRADHVDDRGVLQPVLHAGDAAGLVWQ